MNIKIDLSKTILRDEQKQSISSFCDSLAGVPDLSIQSILLYGSAARTDYRPGRSDINLLIISNRADTVTLQNCMEVVTEGRSAGISPLFLTAADLIKLSEAFPLKYLSIQESHLTLYGDDPLLQIQIGSEALRLRCRQEMLNLLMRLRRNYLYSMGHHLSGFLIASLKSFLEVLRIVLCLKIHQMPTREQTLNLAEKIYGADISVIREMLDIKDSRISPDDDTVLVIYTRYFKLVERILDEL